MAKKVLLGLHDACTMDMCVDIYSGRGHITDQVTDLREMIEFVMKNKYDVYLMDVNLGNRGENDLAPAITVYSLVEDRVKRNEARFLALSGNDLVVDRAIAAGIPTRLKPFTEEDLVELVR